MIVNFYDRQARTVQKNKSIRENVMDSNGGKINALDLF